MKKHLRRLTALTIVLALMLSLFTFTASAEGETYSVSLSGNNVSLLDGTYGQGALDPTADYTTTLITPDGYMLTYVELYTLSNGTEIEFSDYFLDRETGYLTVPKESVYSDLYIKAYATDKIVDKYNAPLDYATEITLPFSDTFIPVNGQYIYSAEHLGNTYALELSKDQQLTVEAYGSSGFHVDTIIKIGYFNEEREEYEYLRFDLDVHNADEQAVFVAPENMTVVVLVEVYESYCEEEVYVSMYTDEITEEDYVDVTFEGINVSADPDAIGENKALMGKNYIIPLTFIEDYITYKADVRFCIGENNHSYYAEYEVLDDNLYIYASSVQGDISIKIGAYTEVNEGNTDDRVTELDGNVLKDKFVPAKSAYYDLYLDVEERNYRFVGNCYKIPVEAGSSYVIKAYGSDTDSEADAAFIYTLYDSNGETVAEELCDETYSHEAEQIVIDASEDGTLYVSVFVYNNYFEEITVDIAVFNENGIRLELTQATEDITEDTYSWNNSTNTLTLEDGFTAFCKESSVILPKDSTLIVKGQAELLSLYGNGIEYSGTLNIILKENASLNIDTSLSSDMTAGILSNSVNGALTVTGNGTLPVISFNASCDAISGLGNITVENCDLQINSSFNGIYLYGYDLYIKNSNVTMNTDQECIYGTNYIQPNLLNDVAVKPIAKATNVFITDSKLNLVSGEEPIQTSGSITLTNCISEIYTDDEEGLDAILCVTVTDGSLKIEASEEGIQSDCIILDGVDLDVKNQGTYSLLNTSFDENSYVSGWYKLYDKDDNCIYEGPWTRDLYDVKANRTGVYDGNDFTVACRIISQDISDGWKNLNGSWFIYENGKKAVSDWREDSVGWCYLDFEGRMLTNAWVRDSVGWCYVGSDGYCLTDCWMQDSVGWCYLNSEGRMATNSWVLDSVGWCYVGEDGYCLTDTWMADSVGWVYLDSNGRMLTNAWVRDSVGWCYVGSDGYCVTNCWVQDSTGWCYLDENGRMVVNDYVYDSHGKCKLDENGYWDGKYV